MKKKPKNPEIKTAIDGNHIHFVMQYGIRIYPIYKSGWYIEVDNNGRKKRFAKKIPQGEIGEATAKTVLFYYNKLKTKENESK